MKNIIKGIVSIIILIWSINTYSQGRVLSNLRYYKIESAKVGLSLGKTRDTRNLNTGANVSFMTANHWILGVGGRLKLN